jgi:hypothetical protein
MFGKNDADGAFTRAGHSDEDDVFHRKINALLEAE